jgi:membrane-associated phospholipid phosphatase
MSQSLRCLALLFLLVLPYSLLAQIHPSSSPSGNFFTDASHVIVGAGHVLTSPLRWRGKNWAIFGSALAGTFALSFVDEPANDLMLRNRSRFAGNLKDFGIEYGEPQTAIVLTGSLYVIGWVADSEWLRESCVIASASLLSSGIIQSTTKYVTGRARPYVGRGHDVFDPFRGEESHYSFFSGHTMVAMIMSHTFARRLDNSVVKVALYGLGGIGGLARMYNHDHWLTDVVFGNAMAITSVNSVAKWLEKRQNGGARGGGFQWRVAPAGRGVSLSAAW